MLAAMETAGKSQSGIGRQHSWWPRPWAFVVGVVLCGAGALPSVALCQTAGDDGDARRQEVVRLVREDCGSCHGLTLKGGLGPALLPENLRSKPDEALVATILYGRPGTPMPPWRPFLSEREAVWIVARLRAGFPEMANNAAAD